MSVIRRKRDYKQIISSTEESNNELSFDTTYDKNSSLRKNSNNNRSVLKNYSSKKYMNTYRNNIKRKNIDNQKRLIHLTSDSDFDNSDNDNRVIKEKKIKRIQNKKQTIIDYDLIDISSSNSSLFEIQNKTMYLRSNNGNKKRCNIVEDIRFVRGDDAFDRQNCHNCNSHLIGTNTSVLQNGQEKQRENFKHHIENVIEGLKYKFSKYKFHISQVQSKYITENIVTLQDAGDMIFIFSSIISKLKEELTEQQKILENSYIKWTMKSSSNEQNGCNINNEDMEIESEVNFNDDDLEMMEVSSQNSSCNEIFSENTHRKQSSDTTKRLKKNVSESNRNTIWQNIRSNNNRDNEIPLKRKDSIVETDQTLATQNDNGNSLQSKKKVLSVLSNLKNIDIIKVPQTNSTVNKKSTVNKSTVNKKSTDIITKRQSLSQNVTDTLKQPVNSKQNDTKKIEIIGYDSDICSSCSTVALYSPQHKHILLSNVDKQTNKLINIKEDVNSDDSESFILDPVMSDDEIHRKSNSQEIVIIPSDKKDNFNTEPIEIKSNSQIVSKAPVALPNKKCQVNCIHSTHEDINSNKGSINQIRNNTVDKKLGLICQVVIDKYKQ